MRFKDKIEHSDLLLSVEKEKGRELKNKQSRKIGIIFSILIAIITIITAFTKKYDQAKQFDILISVLSIVLAFLKVIFSIIIAIIKKSIFSLNHFRLYRTLEIVSNFTLLLIFAINIYNVFSSKDIVDFLSAYDNKINGLIDFYKPKPIDGIIFAVKIIINIPLLFKFLIFSIRNIARAWLAYLTVPIFPIFFFAFLFRTNRIFFEYKDLSEDYYLINKRRINTKFYGVNGFLIKLVVVTIIFLFVYFMVKLVWDFINPDNPNMHFSAYIIMYLIYGLYINLLYFFGNKHLKVINKREKEMDKLVEE